MPTKARDEHFPQTSKSCKTTKKIVSPPVSSKVGDHSMAEAAGPSIGATTHSLVGHQQGLGMPTRADVVRSLIAHKDLFVDIDKHPEGDVRHRFLPERAKRARYVESVVFDRTNAVAELEAGLERDARAGKLEPIDQEYLQRYHEAMVGFDEALTWISRVNEEDFKAANAPVVERHHMDHVFRHFLGQPENGPRAPNGLLRSFYGSIGDPVSPEFMASRGCADDFFRRLILDKLMIPFDKHIFTPIQSFFNDLLGRDAGLHTPGMQQRTLDILVTTLECAVAVGCFAASVTLLYNLKSTKTRMIAAPFASFACATPVIFLSMEAKIISTLVAGIWAVMIVVVFLSEANAKTC